MPQAALPSHATLLDVYDEVSEALSRLTTGLDILNDLSGALVHLGRKRRKAPAEVVASALAPLAAQVDYIAGSLSADLKTLEHAKHDLDMLRAIEWHAAHVTA